MTRKRPRKTEAPKDFPKKKQKVGKGKSTPENVTVVNFKSRSVVVPGQLQRTIEPTTHKKLTLQNLLIQIGHYKPSVRREALNGIRELLEKHQDLLAPNYSKILNRVAPILSDKIDQVRAAFCTLFKYLLDCSSVEGTRPFMPVLIAHLVCGLTDIVDDIQFDSLKVFDILLSRFPTLLIPHAHELLPLLVRLISRQKRSTTETGVAAPATPVSSGGKKGLLSTIQKSLRKEASTSSGNALASNPQSILAAKESRLKIFSHISSYLEVILDSPTLSSCPTENGHRVSPIIDVENGRVFVPKEAEGTLVETDSALCNFTRPIPQVVILKHHGVLPQEDAFLPPSSKGSSHHFDNGLFFPDHQKFVSFINSLILLLLESWVECCPADVFKKEGNVPSKGGKSHQTLPFMETILNTMCSLLKFVNQSDRSRMIEFTDEGTSDQSSQSLIEQLRNKYWGDLRSHVISHFPFSTSGVHSHASSNQSAHFLSMDFIVCHILLLLHPCPSDKVLTAPSFNNSAITNTANLVCSFFVQLPKKGLVSVTTSAPNAIPTLVAFLPLLFHLCPLSDLSEEQMKEMLKIVLAIYDACHPLSSGRQLLVKSFNEQLKGTLERQSRDGTRSLVFTELLFPWIQSLPDLLNSLGNSNPKTSSVVISSISLSALHASSSSMSAVLETTVDLIFSATSVLDQLPPSVQRKGVELLWHLPFPLLTTRLLSQLASFVNSGKCDSSVLRYLVQVIHHRFCGQMFAGLQISAPNYLSFMISVIVGYSMADLRSMQKQERRCDSDSDKQEQPLSTIVLKKPREDLDSSSRIKLVECACRHLQSSPLSSVVLRLVEKVLFDTLSELQILPFDAAFGILKICNCCLASSSDSVVPDVLVSCLVQLCLATLVAMEELHPQLHHLHSPAHPLVTVCSGETERLLLASDSILKELLTEFQKKTTSFDVEKLIIIFIGLLKLPSMASSLRQQREEVLAAALQFSSMSFHKSELDVVISKFRY